MSFEWFVALKFLFSRKKHQAIHIISLISIAGIALGTMALITVLSVFNGFDSVIKSMFNRFDPDLKIIPHTGKFFSLDSTMLKMIQQTEGVEAVAYVVEESVLLQYDDRQYIGAIKGVSDNFLTLHPLEENLQGNAILKKNNIPLALVGMGVAYYLGVNPNLYHPLIIYLPRKEADIYSTPEEAFQRLVIYPSGLFTIEREIDNKYVIVPYDFACKLLQQKNIVSNIEVKVKKGWNIAVVQQKIAQKIGEKFEVLDHYQQQQLLYKIMKSEKWAVFFILVFILIVASLNMLSTLTMTILEKKQNIQIFHYLGADWQRIRRIFLYNGWMSVLLGSLIGLFAGLLLCLLQQHYGFVKLQGMSTFVIDSYPVKVLPLDIVLILTTVMIIGWLASFIPIRMISNRLFNAN
ncbi:MAG TPA: ABC transporter permease [Bacteroidales bacterium]|nr:ABC transporter permease [Bacteroidales bacterium]HOK98340.1 ABC transporter permease [Bacteroidales bacterium]HPO65207.1 ABC transporter permease [Bacteroidales bacterium]